MSNSSAPILLAVRDLREEVHAGFGTTALTIRTLDGVSLELRAGELVVLQGPVAGGAASLVRALAGTRPCAAGARVAAPGVRIRRGTISDHALRALTNAWTDKPDGEVRAASYGRPPFVYMFRVRPSPPSAQSANNATATERSSNDVWRAWAASLRAAGGCVLVFRPTPLERPRARVSAVHESAHPLPAYARPSSGVRVLTLAAGRIVAADPLGTTSGRGALSVASRDRTTAYIQHSPRAEDSDSGS